MPRQSLSGLLGNVEHHRSDDWPAATLKPPPSDRFPTREVYTTEHGHALPQAAADVESAQGELPAYLRMVRKETRLREDQLNQLTIYARKLNRGKTAGAPRITDNTLIRIAVDLLLQRIEQAAGGEEAALLRSLRGSRS